MNINLIIKHLQKTLYFFTINKSLILSQIEGVLKALITPKSKIYLCREVFVEQSGNEPLK